jgi:hypothetical protein
VILDAELDRAAAGVRPGEQHAVVAPLKGEEVLEELLVVLELRCGQDADYGLRYIEPDPVAHVAFPDGKQLTMWLDRDRTAAEIARFAPADAAAYLRMLAEYDEVKSIFSESQFTPVGFGPSLEARLAEHPHGRLWQRRRMLSAWDIIRHEFSSRHVQAFMLWMAFQTNQAVDVPGSGLLAYSLIFGRQQRSWSILADGSGQLTAALTAYLESHGGTVLCNKWVTRLLLDGTAASASRPPTASSTGPAPPCCPRSTSPTCGTWRRPTRGLRSSTTGSTPMTSACPASASTSPPALRRSSRRRAARSPRCPRGPWGGPRT